MNKTYGSLNSTKYQANSPAKVNALDAMFEIERAFSKITPAPFEVAEPSADGTQLLSHEKAFNTSLYSTMLRKK